MYWLQRHWVWPHIMILALVCLVIDLVALGFGIVWLVKYVADIEGSGTAFKITMGSLLAGGRSVLASLQVLQVILPVECDGHTGNQGSASQYQGNAAPKRISRLLRGWSAKVSLDKLMNEARTLRKVEYRTRPRDVR